MVIRTTHFIMKSLVWAVYSALLVFYCVLYACIIGEALSGTVFVRYLFCFGPDLRYIHFLQQPGFPVDAVCRLYAVEPTCGFQLCRSEMFCNIWTLPNFNIHDEEGPRLTDTNK